MRKKNYRICECSFVDLYIWSHKFDTSMCISDGFFFSRARLGGRYSYMLPIGEGDLKEAIGMLAGEAERGGQRLLLHCLTDEMIEELEAAMPGAFEYTPWRDSADYIYLADSLIDLSGKKLHSKRNFVNRFSREFEGRWHFEAIGEGNIADVCEFQLKWCRKNNCDGDIALVQEQVSINMLLDNYFTLGCFGGILYLDGEAIAFTIASALSEDTVVVQIEKADYEIPGAYQMINWLFARSSCRGFTYINREDDMGIDGLRRAKLSYSPHEIKMKYGASLR